MIRASELRFGYGDTNILHGIDLHVRAGEVVAIVGPSGSGKSTLLYCLAGVLRGWSGEIEIDGRSLAGLNDDQLADVRAERCGYVLQFGQLVPELTAIENASLPLRLLGVGRQKANRRAMELLERVGVGHRAHSVSSKMSGGEQQRTAIARALVHQPGVVFADEPTGALDSANSDVVIDLLLEQARQTGTAIVLVTHERQVAERADRILEMSDGLLVKEAAGARVRA